MHLFLKCQNNNSKVIAHMCKGLSGYSKIIQLGLIFRKLRIPPRSNSYYLSCAHMKFGEKVRKKLRVKQPEITIYGTGIQLLAWIIEICDTIMTLFKYSTEVSFCYSVLGLPGFIQSQFLISPLVHSLVSVTCALVCFLLNAYVYGMWSGTDRVQNKLG